MAVPRNRIRSSLSYHSATAPKSSRGPVSGALLRRYPSILLSSAAVTSVLPLAFGLAPIRLTPTPAGDATKAPPAVTLISTDAPAVVSYVPVIPLPLVSELLPSARPRDPRDPEQYVNPIDGKVISSFGYRDGERHDGMDIKGVDKARISASFPGRVIQAGPGQSGYGTTVTLDLGGGVTALFAHLSAVTVRVGDDVLAGDQVGVQGQTGRATTAHLHYEIRINGRAVNPAPYLR